MCTVPTGPDVPYMQGINVKAFGCILWRGNDNNQAMKWRTDGNTNTCSRLFGSNYMASDLAVSLIFKRSTMINQLNRDGYKTHHKCSWFVVCWFCSGLFVFLRDSCAFILISILVHGRITATSNNRHCVSNYWSVECLFQQFVQTDNNGPCHCTFVRGNGDRWFPAHKGTVTRKLFQFDDVIMDVGMQAFSCTLSMVI